MKGLALLNRERNNNHTCASRTVMGNSASSLVHVRSGLCASITFPGSWLDANRSSHGLTIPELVRMLFLPLIIKMEITIYRSRGNAKEAGCHWFVSAGVGESDFYCLPLQLTPRGADLEGSTARTKSAFLTGFVRKS